MMIRWNDGEGREAVKKELKKDFSTCMEKIDFADYRPSSEVFMSALSVGLMWHLINEMEKAEAMKTMTPASR